LKSHSEHVDSHQQLIADELTRRGLAITRDACELELSDLLRASAVRVINRNRQVPFVLRTQGEDG
jgi:UDP-N-acetylglucosamine transferase subunit ALG13